MYQIGKKYKCAWTDFVQILHIKSNGELVLIDSEEIVHIKHPDDWIFDANGSQIRFSEIFEG